MAIDVLSRTGMASVARSNLTRANSKSLSSVSKLSSGNRITNEAFRNALVDDVNKFLASSGTGHDMGIGGSVGGKDINVDIATVTSPFLYESIDVGLATPAQANLTSIQLNKAIDYVTSVRADVGAQQSRLNFASSNMTVAL